MYETTFQLYEGWVEGELVCDKTQKTILNLREHFQFKNHNMVMKLAGVALAASLKGDSSVLNFMSIGTGSSNEINTASSLDAELSRKSVSVNYDTTTSGVLVSGSFSNRLVVTAVFDTSVVGTISEMAIWSSGTSVLNSGIMLSRKKVTPITKTAETSLRLTWNLVF